MSSGSSNNGGGSVAFDNDDDDMPLPGPYEAPSHPTRYFTDYSGKIGGPFVIAFSAEAGVQRVNAVNSHLWISCQCSEHDVFQVRNVWNRSRILKLDRETTGAYTEEEITEYPGKPRHQPSLCNVRNQYVFLIGGLISGTHTPACLRYDIENDRWEDMPELKVAREYHSSCMLGDYIFTVAGTGYDGILNSMEVLKIVTDSEQQINEQWQIISFEESILKPRWHPIMQPFNETEILIAGGYNGNFLNNVVLFDIEDQSITDITEPGKLKFQSLGNQCAQVTPNRIAALVQDKNSDPHMIEFTHGDLTSVLKSKKTC